MEKHFCICSVLVCLLVTPSLEKDIELNIGTLIPYKTWDQHGFKSAIELAAETVERQGLLKGYKLVFHHKDTHFAPAKAIESLIELRAMNSSNAVKICIIGPAVTKVAVHTGQLASIWGTLQVSYGASSPELMSDTYSRFLTMVPTSNSKNRAMIELMNFFKWRRVGVAYDRNVNLKSFYLPTMNALRDNLKSSNVDILVEEGIDSTKNHKTTFIKSLKEKDVRIVIALLANDNLVLLLCEAYKQNFYGDNIVWLTYSPSLKFKTGKNYGCNKTEFNTVSEGMFSIDIQFFRTDMNKTRSGLTVSDFKEEVVRLHPHKYIADFRNSIAFDTVWLLALSLNDDLEKAARMQNTSIPKNVYFNLTDQLRERMKTQDFEGISGRVKFNSSERLGTIVIKQQRKEGVISVAQHHTFSNVLTFFPNQSKPEILFKGNKYVQDGPRHINETRAYSLILFTVIWIVCVLAVIIAVALFYFNFKNREIRYIKMSSPHVNNIIIFGGLLCYIKVFLDTLDSRFVDLETYGRFCNARVWLMSLGFTTAFGAMFSKTWRVHRIFTASKNFKRAVIKNFHLYGLLFALLGVDCILLTAWMVISPYRSGVLMLPVEENKQEDEVIHPYIFNCTSQHENYFLLTTCACKGLLLVFGIFLAWETRNIEIKALNDSKYIGISVYNVVILSVVGVILATLMSGSQYYNVYLALMSVVVILCTAATLGIVFVPKIIGLQRIVNSTGNASLETTYSVKSSDGSQTPCCCCEACKCRCSGVAGRERKASIHVSNKFLAGASNNRRKSRNASVPSISVTKPKVSVHINARVSLSTYPIAETPAPSPDDESPRAGFLSNNEA